MQLSRMLGHHSPDFTLRVYAHLIPGDQVNALDLDAELASARPTVPDAVQNGAGPVALGAGAE